MAVVAVSPLATATPRTILEVTCRLKQFGFARPTSSKERAAAIPNEGTGRLIPQLPGQGGWVNVKVCVKTLGLTPLSCCC